MATFAILLSVPVFAMDDQDPNKTPTVRQSGCPVPDCHCMDVNPMDSHGRMYGMPNYGNPMSDMEIMNPMDSHGRTYGMPNYGNPKSDMELMTLTCTDPNCITCKKQ